MDCVFEDLRSPAPGLIICQEKVARVQQTDSAHTAPTQTNNMHIKTLKLNGCVDINGVAVTPPLKNEYVVKLKPNIKPHVYCLSQFLYKGDYDMNRLSTEALHSASSPSVKKDSDSNRHRKKFVTRMIFAKHCMPYLFQRQTGMFVPLLLLLLILGYYYC
jgi:hypothetical protein